VPLAGRPLLAHAVAAMEANRCVTAVVVVAHPDALGATAKLLADEGFVKVVAVVAGGPTRQASVAAGLAAMPPGPAFLAVHDAARPLPGPGSVDRLLELLNAARSGAPEPPRPAGVVPGVPVVDTVRRVDGEQRSRGIVDRDQLRAVQTPQLFVREALEVAHRRAGLDGVEASDEAALVELAGYPVQVVPGSHENLKVTTAFDLLVAESLITRTRRGPGNPTNAGAPPPASPPTEGSGEQDKEADMIPQPMRVGQGVDVHPLVKGRPLILGGVTIPFDRGLDGHSDGDVVAHAACDALLGAAGLDDLGTQFPADDPALEGASSMDLCRQVAKLVASSGWAAMNLAVTILCDQPRLADCVGQMSANLAGVFALEQASARVTAKAAEGLGFPGRGEGILAIAVCLAVAADL
jgi:2-C-methyl-D-erythritol 4-phosphate cytidylyltransferase/2-C-methyl-D-erythritol 2,4-cyclodiphosphate synthase